MMDNYSVWKAHECAEAKEEAWRMKHLPICQICNKEIDEDGFIIMDDETWHYDCFMREYQMDAEDYLDRFR